MPEGSEKSKSKSSSSVLPPAGSFKCPDCDKTFSRKAFIKRHKTLEHDHVRPFSCNTCDAAFARSDLLSRHKKICSGGKEDGGVASGSGEVKKRKRTVNNAGGGGGKRNDSTQQQQGQTVSMEEDSPNSAEGSPGDGSDMADSPPQTSASSNPLLSASSQPFNNNSTNPTPSTSQTPLLQNFDSSQLSQLLNTLSPPSIYNSTQTQTLQSTLVSILGRVDSVTPSSGLGTRLPSPGLGTGGIDWSKLGIPLQSPSPVPISAFSLLQPSPPAPPAALNLDTILSLMGIPNPSNLQSTGGSSPSPVLDGMNFGLEELGGGSSPNLNDLLFPTSSPVTSLGSGSSNSSPLGMFHSLLGRNDGGAGSPSGAGLDLSSILGNLNSSTTSASTAPSPLFNFPLNFIPSPSSSSPNNSDSSSPHTASIPNTSSIISSLGSTLLDSLNPDTGSQVKNLPMSLVDASALLNLPENALNSLIDFRPSVDDMVSNPLFDGSLGNIGGGAQESSTSQAQEVSSSNDTTDEIEDRRRASSQEKDPRMQRFGDDIINPGSEPNELALDLLDLKREMMRWKAPSIVPSRAYIGDEWGSSSKFFLPAEKWGPQYARWGDKIPLRPKLSRFASLACSAFLSKVPVLHTASMVLAQSSSHLVYALIVTGARYEKELPEDVETLEGVAVNKRPYLLKEFSDKDTTFELKFIDLQAFLIYQFLSLSIKDSVVQANTSLQYHGCTVMMVRQLGLVEKVLEEKARELVDGMHLEWMTDLDEYELEKRWKRWIQVESWKRAVFLTWLSDLEYSARLDSITLIPISEIAIDLPSTEDVWNAPNASTWLTKYMLPKNKPCHFHKTLRVLLSPDNTSLFENNLFPDIGAFTEMILFQTLSHLKWSLERCRSHRRFLPSGLSSIGLAGTNYNDSLKRIERALYLLKRGQSKARGEGWLDEVSPPKRSKNIYADDIFMQQGCEQPVDQERDLPKAGAFRNPKNVSSK